MRQSDNRGRLYVFPAKTRGSVFDNARARDSSDGTVVPLLMAHSSLQIANAILEVGANKGLRFTPLQIIKLTYIAHGWALALLGKPLVDESAEAWLYGPVFPKLYQELKKYGSSVVPHRIEGIAMSFQHLGEPEKSLLKEVIDVYGTLSGTQLSSLTHQPGTPWHQTWNKNGRNASIPNRIIQEHYKELAAEKQ